MSITDELRRVAAKTECANGRCEKLYRGDLDHIADRIDAEHEAACAEAYGNGVMSVPIALDESAWVELPKGADGEYIHIGDVVENVICPSVHREVTGVGAECFYAWEDGFGRYSQFGANCYRHHHEPTVEDVLREFAEKIIDSQIPSIHPTYEEAITEFAARLRLAEEDA